MKSFIEQAQIYAAYHRKPETRFTHMAGVPLVILSFMILLGFVKIIVPGIFMSTLAWFATLALLIYYFILNWKLALAITPILLFLLWISDWLSAAGPTTLGVWSFIITFIAGWALQFYGHFLEGRRPAFLDNLSQALVAPLFLVAELFFMAGFMKNLQLEIYGTPNIINE
ncbi:MAG: hypothetical protein BGO90_00445 [Legionella sp. 40-6]|nr:DUF962 domain-containing protein [Legionella sp.]OJY46286.1 MAG: hypothetical protein BGO90_00445 [Legionella sp. 40-6]